MPPPPLEFARLHELLQAMRRSGLFDPRQLEDLVRQAPSECRAAPEQFTDYLVKIGQLARLQARRLLEGTPQGLLLGPFRVLAPLGKGGSGAVYLVRDGRSQALLALKVLPPKRARTDTHLVTRFRREMELCQRV